MHTIFKTIIVVACVWSVVAAPAPNGNPVSTVQKGSIEEGQHRKFIKPPKCLDPRAFYEFGLFEHPELIPTCKPPKSMPRLHPSRKPSKEQMPNTTIFEVVDGKIVGPGKPLAAVQKRSIDEPRSSTRLEPSKCSSSYASSRFTSIDHPERIPHCEPSKSSEPLSGATDRPSKDEKPISSNREVAKDAHKSSVTAPKRRTRKARPKKKAKQPKCFDSRASYILDPNLDYSSIPPCTVIDPIDYYNRMNG